MIVLNSPKGWTGPKEIDGLQIEGTFRAHQVPIIVDSEHPDHLKNLESWMKSYKAEELFDEQGRLNRSWLNWRPKVRADGSQSAHQRWHSAARLAHADFMPMR